MATNKKAPSIKKPSGRPKGSEAKCATVRVKQAKATRSIDVKKRRVTFKVRAESGSRVFLAGTFNNWDTSAKQMVDKKGDGNFTAVILLAPGSYEYKFLIDGTWCADPECKEWLQNEHGTLNSVIKID